MVSASVTARHSLGGPDRRAGLGGPDRRAGSARPLMMAEQSLAAMPLALMYAARPEPRGSRRRRQEACPPGAGRGRLSGRPGPASSIQSRRPDTGVARVGGVTAQPAKWYRGRASHSDCLDARCDYERQKRLARRARPPSAAPASAEPAAPSPAVVAVACLDPHHDFEIGRWLVTA